MIRMLNLCIFISWILFKIYKILFVKQYFVDFTVRNNRLKVSNISITFVFQNRVKSSDNWTEYPPPFPLGWTPILLSSEVKTRPLFISRFDRHLMVRRNSGGVVKVCEAYKKYITREVNGFLYIWRHVSVTPLWQVEERAVNKLVFMGKTEIKLNAHIQVREY